MNVDAHADGARIDPRPRFRVAVFGLGRKFQRLMEIVLRHARHNPYRYELADSSGPGEYDIALVDMTARGGPEVVSALRGLARALPVVRVGRRNDEVRGRDDLLQAFFTMNLLKTLNGVVEQTLLGRRPAPPPLADPVFVDSGAGAPRRARALLVDDSAAVRRQLAVALHRMGVESEGAATAAEALEMLVATRFELIFVDVVMPAMDGYELTRAIKRDPALRRVPVVILTGRSSPLDLARGALAGCNSYLVKPVALQSLRDTVFRHLSRHPAPGSGSGLSFA